jgi:TPR repeat protein
MGKNEIAVASATYTIANQKVAEALGKKAKHSGKPSLDLDEIVADIPEAMKEKALEWYERGIKRGMKKATDLMLAGEIHMQDGAVLAPKTITIKVRTRFKNEEWNSRKYIIKTSDIGFED